MKHAAPTHFLPERVADCADYFRRQRAECIRRYKAAKFWPDRITARHRVLHYGRLIRKLEGWTK